MTDTLIDHLRSLRAAPDVRQAGGKDYESHILHTLKVLKAVDQDEFISKNGDHDILEDLDTAADTLSYLFTLRARINKIYVTKQFPDELRPGAPLWASTVSFLERCDPIEVRYVGHYWVDLLNVVGDSADHTSVTSQKIPVLSHMATAMLRLDPSCSVFTSQHLALVSLGLTKHISSQVLPILTKTLSHIPGKSGQNVDGLLPCSAHCPARSYITHQSGFVGGKVTLQDLQQYFILAALNLIALHEWSRASFYLENVLVTPCERGANGYMVEAYKKWILVNLLAHGRLRDLPHGIQQSTRKIFKGVAKPYESVAEAFVKTNQQRVLAEIQEGNTIWHEDGNVGLMQQLLCDHQTRSIIRLGTTYAALPLPEVASKIKMSEDAAGRYLNALIQQRTLHAALEQRANGQHVLRFFEGASRDSLSKPELQLRDDLIQQTRRIQRLAEDIKEADHSLSMHKAYIESARRARKKGDQATGEDDPMDTSYGPTGEVSEDEDVMAEE